jgi:hypothetical protein
MDRGPDIIPIDSRRRLQGPERPLTADWGSVRWPGGVAGGFIAGLMFVVMVAATGTDPGAKLRDLPAAERETLYWRALNDVKSTCALPGALLGDHCQRQARLLTMFPECDAACWSAASRVLPRARW